MTSAGKIAMDNTIENAGLKLNELLFTTHTSFMFDRNNFMIDLFDEIIERLLPSGIIQHLKNKYGYSTSFILKHGPKVLSVDDLSYGFIIWLVTCAMSLSVFVLEIVFYFSKETMKIFLLEKLLDKAIRNFIGIK